MITNVKQFFCLLFILLMGCNNPAAINKPDNLTGYWIPSNIDWKSADKNDKELGDIIQNSYFRILYLSGDGKCKLFESYQTQKKGSDSITFGTEPGINCYKGNWRHLQPDKILIEFDKPIPSFDNHPYREETKVLNDFLIFSKVKFVKTKYFHKHSIDRMMSF